MDPNADNTDSGNGSGFTDAFLTMLGAGVASGINLGLLTEQQQLQGNGYSYQYQPYNTGAGYAGGYSLGAQSTYGQRTNNNSGLMIILVIVLAWFLLKK